MSSHTVRTDFGTLGSRGFPRVLSQSSRLPKANMIGQADQQAAYRIFSIKRRGLLFKSRPRRPGVYSGPGVYLLSAFFNHLVLSSVLVEFY